MHDIERGLLVHSLRFAPSGERVVTFDQWAQLFDWVAARLGLHNEATLHRLGIDTELLAMPQPRQPLKVRPRVRVMRWDRMSAHVVRRPTVAAAPFGVG